MRINQQPISKKAKQSKNQLLIHSIFYTIQGEGPFSGYPAIFVRLAGCNLQCPGCDTEYTQGASLLHISEIIEKIKLLTIDSNHNEPLIVITGGEPFRQDIAMFVNTMHLMGHLVQVETNGTLPPSIGLLYDSVKIVCSPKTGAVNPKLFPRITAYKYVTTREDIAKDDGLPDYALFHTAKPRLARPHDGFEGPVYLQPMDEQDKELNLKNQEAAIDSCIKHGHILQLQLHKIIGVE